MRFQGISEEFQSSTRAFHVHSNNLRVISRDFKCFERISGEFQEAPEDFKGSSRVAGEFWGVPKGAWGDFRKLSGNRREIELSFRVISRGSRKLRGVQMVSGLMQWITEAF